MQSFKSIDYFRKIQQDVKRESTAIGGIIGVCTIITIIVLVTYETFCAFFGHYKTYPFINNVNLHDKVRVNLNITFEEVFCKALSVDYQDTTGTHLEDIAFTIHKIRLDKFGRFIDYDQAEEIKKQEKQKFYPGNPFFEVVKSNAVQAQFQNNVSCYGAELYEGQICLSCSDVLIAFAQRGWQLPMKEQISQCNESTKEVFKTVKMLDGEVKSNKAVSHIHHPPDQNNLIETLKRQNVVEQIINQIDQRILDLMDKEDKQFFDENLIQINELQYNPSDQSEQQIHQEIMYRVQSLQALVGKYYSQLEALKPRQIQLSVSTLMVNLYEITPTKKILFQFSVSRPICNEEIIYKVKLQSDLSTTSQNYNQTNNLQSEFLKPQGKQIMKAKECSHVFPIFIEQSFTNKAMIIISIPDFDIQQQFVLDKRSWFINLELIKDEETFKVVSDSNKKQVRIQYSPQDNIDTQQREIESRRHQQQKSESERNRRDQTENVEKENQQQQKVIIQDQDSNSKTKNNENELEQNQKNNIQGEQNDSNPDNDQQQNKSKKNRMLFSQSYGREELSGVHEFSQQEFKDMQQQMIDNEKCQIFGHFYIKKVPGNFHISFHNEGLLTLYFHQIFNLRHTINNLEFTTVYNYYLQNELQLTQEDGKLSLGSYTKSSNPLDKTKHNPGHGIDNDYYLKIVNTIYENILSNHTNIYSFTSLELIGRRDFRLPSVNFRYEFDPITVLHYRKSRSITQFIVSLCAIIGGSIAISKYIHILLVK